MIMVIVGWIRRSILRLSGRNLFHVKYMSLSYRIRGNVHRIHTNAMARIIVFIISKESLITYSGELPVKNTTDNNLIIRIFVYSAMKIRANNPPLYSVLNPDTSSDSPSAKSNGVRLVSAKFVVNQIMNNGVSIKMIQYNEFEDMIFISMDW